MTSNADMPAMQFDCYMVKSDSMEVEKLSYGLLFCSKVNGVRNTIILSNNDVKKLSGALLKQLEGELNE